MTLKDCDHETLFFCGQVAVQPLILEAVDV
jgi:hypothetical protein